MFSITSRPSLDILDFQLTRHDFMMDMSSKLKLHPKSDLSKPMQHVFQPPYSPGMARDELITLF